jgi:hypothetical protein
MPDSGAGYLFWNFDRDSNAGFLGRVPFPEFLGGGVGITPTHGFPKVEKHCVFSKKQNGPVAFYRFGASVSCSAGVDDDGVGWPLRINAMRSQILDALDSDRVSRLST